MGNDLAERGLVDLAGVGRDVALGQHGRVAGRVDSGDHGAAPLPLLGHPGGPGEQIDGGRRPGPGQQITEDRDQAALRADVLDHRPRWRGTQIVRLPREWGSWSSTAAASTCRWRLVTSTRA